MVINTFGDKQNEKVLLIHPMFTSAKFFERAINKLKDKYFLIVPTLSGHYENSTYIKMEDEEREITNFLVENEIYKLKMVIGFSLGGNIAFDYFCKNADKIERVVVDSAPIFKFPKLVKNHFFKKYKKCLFKIKQENVDIAKELNKCFHGMGESQKEVAPSITINSLENLIESCYNVDTPKLARVWQEKITFLYGSKDIARLCKVRLNKYKYGKNRKLKGLNHCEYFMNNLDMYLSDLKL